MHLSTISEASRDIAKHLGSIYEASGRPLDSVVKPLEASARHLGCCTVPRRKAGEPPEEGIDLHTAIVLMRVR